MTCCIQRRVRRSGHVIAPGEDIVVVPDVASQVWFLSGAEPAPLALPTPGPFFVNVFAHFTERLLSPLRLADAVALYGPVGGSPAVSGVPTLERRWISDRLRPGAVFDLARFTSVILVGSAAPNNSCIPLITIYAVNSAGVVLAGLLAGNFTGGVAYAAGNNYMHVIRGDQSAVLYTAGNDDHLVYEFGIVGNQTVTGFGSQIGCRPAAYPSTNAVPFHVAGFNNVGNPGVRTPYLETDLVAWPP